MITFFTTAKSFHGHSGIIQRNALRSWKMLHPSVEVILFGDEEGAAEVCAEFALRHEPHVERHESGMKYLNYLFEKAQAIARYNYLCYSNCDIVFLDDFYQAFIRASRWRVCFLMVGQRWDTDITEPIDFTSPGWAGSLRQFAKVRGVQQKRHFVDYFLFSKGLYDGVPPLVVGRSWWDHWLVWKALSRNVPVVDCSEAILAIHQNHGYGYHPHGKDGTNDDGLAQRNRYLAGNGKQLRSTVDATHAFRRNGVIRRAPFHKFIVFVLPNLVNFVIFNTFWIRKRLGLRRKPLNKLAQKLRFRV
jgi:hypothetical protein